MKAILVPIDFSESTDAVLEAAIVLARAVGARIALAHVFNADVIHDEFSAMLGEYGAAEEKTASEHLARLQKGLQGRGLSVEAGLLWGWTADAIRAEAQRLAAAYIVIGSHGHGALYTALIGSTASQLLQKAPCPVLVVPADGLPPVKAESAAVKSGA
jgi:nucleotide-binding universal stress UspA family protein